MRRLVSAHKQLKVSALLSFRRGKNNQNFDVSFLNGGQNSNQSMADYFPPSLYLFTLSFL